MSQFGPDRLPFDGVLTEVVRDIVEATQAEARVGVDGS